MKLIFGEKPSQDCLLNVEEIYSKVTICPPEDYNMYTEGLKNLSSYVFPLPNKEIARSQKTFYCWTKLGFSNFKEQLQKNQKTKEKNFKSSTEDFGGEQIT